MGLLVCRPKASPLGVSTTANNKGILVLSLILAPTCKQCHQRYKAGLQLYINIGLVPDQASGSLKFNPHMRLHVIALDIIS